jgi:hypothetical protein
MTCSAPSPNHALLAFDGFAPFYDSFTAHDNYEAWIETLFGLAKAHGVRARRLLDVGYGIGKSVLPFLQRGFDVTACDMTEPEELVDLFRGVARNPAPSGLLLFRREHPLDVPPRDGRLGGELDERRHSKALYVARLRPSTSREEVS